MKTILFPLFGLAFIFPKMCSENDIDPHTVSPIGEVEHIQSGFSFTEGPAVDKYGNVFFTDQPNDKIYRWDAATGEITTFLEETGRSNGMSFDENGFLIACADLHGELWKIAPNGSHEVLVDNHNGKLLNGPNDVWINPITVGMYITDPMFPRAYWEPGDPRSQPWPPTSSEQTEERKGGHVYYLAPGASELVRVTEIEDWDSDSWPNGVVGTPDGRKLYINKWASDNLGGTWAFKIKHDGTLSDMEKISDIGGDGMSMDNRGNIYISNGFGIVVLDPNGEELLTIDTGGGTTNNVFAKPNEKTLFITTKSGVSSVKMNVRGVEKF